MQHSELAIRILAKLPPARAAKLEREIVATVEHSVNWVIPVELRKPYRLQRSVRSAGG